MGNGVTAWVSGSMSTLYLTSLSLCLASHFPFFFFLRFLLSPFGFGLLRAEVFIFIIIIFYFSIFTWVIGSWARGS